MGGEGRQALLNALFIADVRQHPVKYAHRAAKISRDVQASRPEIRRNGSVYLRHARHPLLDSGKAMLDDGNSQGGALNGVCPRPQLIEKDQAVAVRFIAVGEGSDGSGAPSHPAGSGRETRP